MKTKERNTARKLRSEGFSLREIAKRVKASKGAISYWVKDVKLPQSAVNRLKKRSCYAGAQVVKQKYEKIRESFQSEGRSIIRHELNPYFIAGLMLFWAEGHKRRNSVVFTNSDPDMMHFFVSFLKTFFKVKSNSIRLAIHWHKGNGLSYPAISNFWLKKLKLRKDSLNKDWVDKRGKEPNLKTGKLPYGIASIAVHDTRTAKIIYGAIQEFTQISRNWIDLRRS